MPLHAVPEAELRDYCRRAIENLEFWLRRLVHDVLTEAYGADYIVASRENGQHIINNEIRGALSGRREKEPERYSRSIDAAHFEEAIRIICNPELYRRHFSGPLEDAFPAGREQAWATLNKLIEPRNALAHANPISVRQAEQVICYSGDVVGSLKLFYARQHMAEQYDVPSVIKWSDSFGTTLHAGELNRNSEGVAFLLFDDVEHKHLHVGDKLSIEVEVDPSFSPNDYRVEWQIPGEQPRLGSKLVLEIEARHVNRRFHIGCQVHSNKPWHKFGHCDDWLAIWYRVLPPT